MFRIISVLIFALILLGLAGHLFYDQKSKNETGHNPSTWMHHLAQNAVRVPVS